MPALAVRRDVPAATARTTPTEAPVARQEPPCAVSPAGTQYRPSVRSNEGPRGGGADWVNARTYFRTPDVGDWMVELRRRPEIFTSILSDIYRETQAEKRRLEGQAKIGRRPRVIDGSLNDLWSMITPRYANEPFVSSILALVGDLDPAEIAERSTIGESTVRRMLAGQDITMWRLEVLARAFAVSPAYFAEWRRSYVLTVMEELLCSQPNLSVKYARALASVVGPLSHKKGA